MPFYAGLDWAKDYHAVCVLDERGKIQTQFLVPHCAEGMAELIRKLSRFLSSSPSPSPWSVPRVCSSTLSWPPACAWSRSIPTS